jgi:hypothetical protein
MPKKPTLTSTAADLLPVPVEVIERRIYLIRRQKVNKAVKRNLNRFPEDFIFQLSQKEAQSLRFQIGMSKP